MMGWWLPVGTAPREVIVREPIGREATGWRVRKQYGGNTMLIAGLDSRDGRFERGRWFDLRLTRGLTAVRLTFGGMSDAA